jgi:hypothetical protein
MTMRDGNKEEDDHVREGRDEIKRSGADRIAKQVTSPGGTITAEPKSTEIGNIFYLCINTIYLFI